MPVLVDSLIGVSDLHVACQLGLCPPKGGKMDGGGHYNPSAFQQWMWAKWREFWDDWVPMVTRGGTYGVVVAGDAVQGRSNRWNTNWTTNLSVQRTAAYEILAPIVEQCEGRYWHLRGTEAHTGPSAEEEETLAKDLHAIPNEIGQHARYELWKYIGKHEEILTHWLHHIGTTSASAYEGTAVHKELVEAYVDAAKWHTRPPDFIVRAHRHRFFKTEIATENERGVSLVLPGWQGKTPFTFRLAIARQSLPMFGGVMIRLSEEGEPYERHKVWRLERPKPE